MARVLYNPRQSAETRIEHFKGQSFTFFKDRGYSFSDDKEMDEIVDHFLDIGFKYVEAKKEKVSPSVNNGKKESKPKKKNDSKFAKILKKKGK